MQLSNCSRFICKLKIIYDINYDMSRDSFVVWWSGSCKNAVIKAELVKDGDLITHYKLISVLRKQPFLFLIYLPWLLLYRRSHSPIQIKKYSKISEKFILIQFRTVGKEMGLNNFSESYLIIGCHIGSPS